MEVAAQGLDQAGAVHDLGIEPLERQEHDAEVRGRGHAQVLVADVLGLALDHHVERLARGGHGVGVARILSLEQMLVCVARELGVDGQQDRVALLDGQFDGELDALRGARLGHDVLEVLVGREDVGEDRAQLHLAQDAARLDVAEHALEVAHARRDGLHVAEPLVHGLELIAHLLERAGQTVVERTGQLLVHRGAHLIELVAVVLADGAELRIDGLAHLVQTMLDALAVGAELLRRLAAQVVHAVARLRELTRHAHEALLVERGGRRLLLRDAGDGPACLGKGGVDAVERGARAVERLGGRGVLLGARGELDTEPGHLYRADGGQRHSRHGNDQKHDIHASPVSLHRVLDDDHHNPPLKQIPRTAIGR